MVRKDGVFQDLRVELLEGQVVLIIGSTTGASLVLMQGAFARLGSKLVDRNHHVLVLPCQLGSTTSHHALKHVVHKMDSWRRSS